MMIFFFCFDSAVEEDSQMVLQDTVRLRDRAKKRDRDRERERERDREFSNHHKRRRGDSLTVGEEERSEESVAADEEDSVIEERRVAHAISHNSTSLSSSSLSNQNSRKSLPPTRLPVKQAPALKAADELIGALVPRKARSGTRKRQTCLKLISSYYYFLKKKLIYRGIWSDCFGFRSFG